MPKKISRFARAFEKRNINKSLDPRQSSGIRPRNLLMKTIGLRLAWDIERAWTPMKRLRGLGVTLKRP